MVSSANARGVMQVMPGTWSYVQENLADRALDPNSATDNVHAGVLYLKRLLDDTGGDESAAIAGYYQGLALRPLARHVRRHPAVRGQRAGAARPLRRLTRPLQDTVLLPPAPAAPGRAVAFSADARHQPRRGEAERQRRDRDERPGAEQQREQGAEQRPC